MDKRAKRLIADIQKSLSANPSKIPTKTIEKLIGKANGTEKLHHLLVSTKYALENGQAESALMLAAVSLTSYPENEDCRTTFGSILQLCVPPSAIWKLIENYLKKEPDQNLIVRFRQQIRFAGREDLVTHIPKNLIETDPLLITLEANYLRKESPELALARFQAGMELLKAKVLDDVLEGEFLYFYGEHLLSLGRYADICKFLLPFVSDYKKINAIPTDQQNLLRAVLSSAQSRLGDHVDALKSSLTRSIEKLPIEETNASFVYNIALIFSNLDLRETAAELYYLAFKMDKTDAAAGFHALYQESHACQWEHRSELATSCQKAISTPFRQGSSALRASRMLASCAFSATTLFDSMEIQSQLLERSREALVSLPIGEPRPPTQKSPSEKIKIAYLSADIYTHATAFLISGLLESHNRDEFEVHVYSYGHNDPNDPFRRRIREAVGDRFLDVSRWSDDAICASITNQKIDIAIELKGFTQNGRPFLLNSKPAPVQINYLGYPASMGSPAIDYFVGDRFTLTEHNRAQFSEKVVTLPVFYQPPDTNRRVAEEIPDKTKLGLPEKKTILGAFNSIYKLTPEVFDIWLRLLKTHTETVLWLTEPSKSGQKRLLQITSEYGIETGRVVFAPFLAQDQHISRLKLIDIFLDTYPCVGHTTATDALFQGIPMVTIAGSTFASRVAASALDHIECQELIAHSLEDYFEIVSELIKDTKYRDTIKNKVMANTLKYSLFDTQRYTRTWEKALTTIYEHWRQGLPPTDLSIE